MPTLNNQQQFEDEGNVNGQLKKRVLISIGKIIDDWSNIWQCDDVEARVRSMKTLGRLAEEAGLVEEPQSKVAEGILQALRTLPSKTSVGIDLRPPMYMAKFWLSDLDRLGVLVAGMKGECISPRQVMTNLMS